MKEIPLTQGKFALVDDEDFERVNKLKWHLKKGKHVYYAYANININNKKTHVLLHRYILNYPEMQIDHIDCDGLNNQKLNLRLVTNTQNQMNKRSRINSSSKYKGVTYDKNTGKYKAKITLNKIEYRLGSFTNEFDAAKAYDEMAKKLFKEYARLNITNNDIYYGQYI